MNSENNEKLEKIKKELESILDIKEEEKVEESKKLNKKQLLKANEQLDK